MPGDLDADPIEAQGLGPPRAEFRANNARAIACVVIAGLMAIGSLSAVLFGFFGTFEEPVINQRVMAILLGTIGLVLAVILFASHWKKYGQHVLVFADGLLVYRRGTWSLLPWADMTAVWRYSATIEGSRALAETDLWIQMKDGKTTYLTAFLRDMDKLVDIVLAETAQRMVPTMLAQLQDGQQIVFGKLDISATGLCAFGKALAWEDVQAIRVAFGMIYIEGMTGKRSWYTTQVWRMPNYHVFLTLADMLLKRDGPQLSEPQG